MDTPSEQTNNSEIQTSGMIRIPLAQDLQDKFTFISKNGYNMQFGSNEIHPLLIPVEFGSARYDAVVLMRDPGDDYPVVYPLKLDREANELSVTHIVLDYQDQKQYEYICSNF